MCSMPTMWSPREPMQGTRFLHPGQIRRSVGGIAAKHQRSLGRRPGSDHHYRPEIARGEAEETISWLRSNLGSRRISDRQYWPIHNLLVTIVKMLDALMPQ